MGDILTLIDQAQARIDENQAKRAMRRFIDGQFDLDDMLAQLEQVKKMGSLSSFMHLIPGIPKISKQQLEEAEVRLTRTKTIIQSMTKDERKHPDIIKGSRKERIAKGAGKDVGEVNFVLKMFEQAKQQSKTIKTMLPKGMI
jgi:signal recognition particle subunit SRP54